MNKFISFKPEFIPLIKNGIKTVTRRIKFKGVRGEKFYFKAGRTGKKEGYIRIITVDLENLQDLENEAFYNREDLCDEKWKEGLGRALRKSSRKDITNEFIEIWNKINNRPGARWKDNPLVYRIEFEYLDISNSIFQELDICSSLWEEL